MAERKVDGGEGRGGGGGGGGGWLLPAASYDWDYHALLWVLAMLKGE